MNKGYGFLLSLALIGSIMSCKKEDKIEIPKEFPVDLVAERWEVREETRLFSDNKEIKDAATIQAFEEDVDLKAWIEDSSALDEGSAGLKFGSELTAYFYPSPGDELPFDVNRKGNRFLFYSRGTYGVDPSVPPSVESMGFLHTMLKYSDALGNPSSQGIRQTREVRVAHGNYKVMKLSAFVYALRRHIRSEEDGYGGSSFREHSGVILNEFDVDVIKFLGATDTLAVKEYSIICSLRK